MAKVHKFLSAEKEERFWVFCPGCKIHHEMDKRWAFNGDLDVPTFSPSLLCNPNHPPTRCHSFIKNGKWEFLNDSHHELAGKTVDMIDVDF